MTQDGILRTIEGRWDIIIGHPTCTYLTNSSSVRMVVKGVLQQERWEKAMEAKRFFLSILNADCDHVCVENPVPMKRVELPPYDQIIQPFWFGEPWQKKTCLWLKGLPKLKPTNMVTEYQPWVNGGNKNPDGTYRRFKGRNERDPKNRSKTFWGIARAIAHQWSECVEKEMNCS